MRMIEFYQPIPQNISNPFEMIGFLNNKGYSNEEIAQYMYALHKQQESIQYNTDRFENIFANALGKALGKSIFIPLKL